MRKIKKRQTNKHQTNPALQVLTLKLSQLVIISVTLWYPMHIMMLRLGTVSMSISNSANEK